MSRNKKLKGTEKLLLPEVSTLLLLTVSLCMLAYFTGFKVAQLSSPTFEYIPTVTSKENSEALPPVQLQIQSLNIDTPIEESSIVKGKWQISKTGISHLSTSAKPGESSNIVLYGHNQPKFLGSLKRIKKNDIITLRSFDHKIFSYKVTEISVVYPRQIEVVLPTKSETLTIFTCTGIADTKRFVVRAKPVNTDQFSKHAVSLTIYKFL